MTDIPYSSCETIDVSDQRGLHISFADSRATHVPCVVVGISHHNVTDRLKSFFHRQLGITGSSKLENMKTEHIQASYP